jgi:hypothetical protein
MAKTSAPALSFDAAGSIAKTMVYTRWKGIPVVRRYVIPANPRTEGQTLTRDIFKTMGVMWNFLPAIGREPWDAFARGRPFTARNQFQGKNVAAIRADPLDFGSFIGSPGALGGLPPTSITPTPGATNVSFAVAVPAAPTGWTIEAAQGVGFLDTVPTDEWSTPIYAVEDTSSTYALDFTGLVTATDYMFAIWLKWEKPNGDFAYSISIGDQVTTS